MINKTFLTGSRAYGTPRPDSDIDVVVKLSKEQIESIKSIADKHCDYPNNGGSSLHFGKMNLICVTTDERFQLWAEGTANLMTKAPVTRDEAVQHFESKGVESFPKGASQLNA